MRKLPIHEGSTAWLLDIPQYPLPAGLQPDMEVLVIRGTVPGEHTVIVRDREGRDWELLHLVVCTGYEFHLDGRWLHESAPCAIAWLRSQLAEAPPPAGPIWASARQAALDRREVIRKHLRRLGADHA